MNDTGHNAPERFTPEELHALRTLRVRYQEDNDCFSDDERAQLRFLRWLHDLKRDDMPQSLNGTEDVPGGDR